VKSSPMHDFFYVQSINMIPLVQFKDVISFDVYKRCENKSRKTYYSLIQESFLDYMYKAWFFSRSFHLKLSFFKIETCDLQKSFFLGTMWASSCSRCGHKTLLWGSFEWEIDVTFQIVGTYGQGNGLGPKGSSFAFKEHLLACNLVLGLNFLK